MLNSIAEKVRAVYQREVHKCMVYASKKEETIMKKTVVVNPDARKSISAQDLCQS